MYEDDFEDDGGSNLVKDLRRQLKQALKDKDEMAEQMKALATQNKQRSIQEVLTSKGANPKLAKFLLADGVEDEAGAEKWLAENGEMFGFTPKADPAVDDEDIDAMRQVQEATSTGGQVNPSRLAAQEKHLNEAETPEEWAAAVYAMKAGQVDGL